MFVQIMANKHTRGIGCVALALGMMAAAAETPSGDPANGKRLFMTYLNC